MTAAPRPRKRPLKFAQLEPFRHGRPDPQRDDRFDRASPVDRYSKAAEDFAAMCTKLNVTKTELESIPSAASKEYGPPYWGPEKSASEVSEEKPLPSDLEINVATFFRRVERVTVHVLDRISTLALRGARYLDERKR